MKRRYADSTLDAVRIVVVVVLLLFFRFHHGQSSGPNFESWNSTELSDFGGIWQNSTEFSEEEVLSDFEGISQNSTEFLEEGEGEVSDREEGKESDESLNSTVTVLTNTTTTRKTQRRNDSIDGRNGRQRIRRLESRLDSSNCTLQAVFHEIQGRLLNPTPPCHLQYFTTSRPIPLADSTNWTHSYSFRLSSLSRNGNIVNASILFPVSVARATTGNWSSLRIGAEIQLIGHRGVAFRALSSQRFRRRDFPENLCVQVFSTTVVKELIRNGNEALVTNVRLTNGSVLSNSDWQIRGPFLRVDAVEAEPCSIEFSKLIPT